MLRLGFLHLTFLLVSVQLAFCAEEPAETSARKLTDLFQTVPRMRITIDDDARSSLRFEPRSYVKAQITEGSISYTNVAIKLKGARGSFRPIDDQPAFTLNFDKFTEGQEFFELDKIHLNNSVQDPTYLNEFVSSRLFLAAGVPTARATHARVSLNEVDLGLYVLKEGYDKRFLKRHFGDNDGNLYDGGFLNDIDDLLEKDSGDGPDDWSDLDKLLKAVSYSDLDKRLSETEKILDLDKFITFTAMEMLTCHWDGYSHNRNNYRLYHNPATGKFVFIPHAMDQMFWEVNYSLVPTDRTGRRGWRRRGVVTEKVMQIPDVHRRYIVRMGELLTNVFTVEHMERLITEAEGRIRREIGRSDPRLSTYVSSQARFMRRHLAARVQAAQAQYTDLRRMLRDE
jgi:spore coat protein CotH